MRRGKLHPIIYLFNILIIPCIKTKGTNNIFFLGEEGDFNQWYSTVIIMNTSISSYLKGPCEQPQSFCEITSSG